MKTWRALNEEVMSEGSITSLVKILTSPELHAEGVNLNFPFRVLSRIERVRKHQEMMLIASRDVKRIQRWAKIVAQLEAIFDETT